MEPYSRQWILAYRMAILQGRGWACQHILILIQRILTYLLYQSKVATSKKEVESITAQKYHFEAKQQSISRSGLIENSPLKSTISSYSRVNAPPGTQRITSSIWGTSWLPTEIYQAYMIHRYSMAYQSGITHMIQNIAQPRSHCQIIAKFKNKQSLLSVVLSSYSG